MSRIGHIAAHSLAIELLKEAGFVVDHVASKTETVYMAHTSSAGKLMRVSTHKFNGSPMGLSGVAANCTLSSKDPYHTPTNVRNRVLFSIGQYFLGQARTSGYSGPKEKRERPSLWLEGAMNDAYETGWRPEGFGGKDL